MRKYLVSLLAVWASAFAWARGDVIETVLASDVKGVWLGSDGSLDMVPMVVIPGHTAVLYGADTLENPDWHEIDPNVPMQGSGYHFFKFVLK